MFLAISILSCCWQIAASWRSESNRLRLASHNEYSMKFNSDEIIFRSCWASRGHVRLSAWVGHVILWYSDIVSSLGLQFPLPLFLNDCKTLSMCCSHVYGCKWIEPSCFYFCIRLIKMFPDRIDILLHNFCKKVKDIVKALLKRSYENIFINAFLQKR